MRRTWRTTSALIMMALMAAPAVAQRGPGQGGMRGQGPGRMDGGPGDMARNPAAAVLEHRDVLELTAEQVARLEAIRDRVQAENGPRWERIVAAFGDVDPRELSPEERRAHRERMRALRPVREEIRATNRAAGEEIHTLLTEAQEAKLVPLMHGDRPRPGSRPHRGRGPVGGGPAGGGPGGGGASR